MKLEFANAYKCNYCDYVCPTVEELSTHLNSTHTKCPCGTVWDNKDVDEDYEYTLCQKCFVNDEIEKEGFNERI